VPAFYKDTPTEKTPTLGGVFLCANKALGPLGLTLGWARLNYLKVSHYLRTGFRLRHKPQPLRLLAPVQIRIVKIRPDRTGLDRVARPEAILREDEAAAEPFPKPRILAQQELRPPGGTAPVRSLVKRKCPDRIQTSS